MNSDEFENTNTGNQLNQPTSSPSDQPAPSPVDHSIPTPPSPTQSNPQTANGASPITSTQSNLNTDDNANTLNSPVPSENSKKRHHKSLWITLSIIGGVVVALLLSYIIFLINVTGGTWHFGEKFEIEGDTVYFVPWKSCDETTERMHCSVTADPYRWCHCERKYDANGNEMPITDDKPIIYLYPTAETEVSVQLGHPENLTTDYPAYQDGWHVLASPSGDLTDLNTGNHFYSLYWEGKTNTYSREISDGFIVKGADTAEFLEEKLTILGLNYREREEFIIYWLPKLEQNPYNYIRFATPDEIETEMPLEVTPKPDTTIRVRMLFKSLENPQTVPEQILTPAPARTGFTLVEWGATEL